jgi:aconitase B
MGDVVDVLPYDGKIVKNGETVTTFQLKSDVLFDEVRAGGRINLIIGRSLTAKAREFLGLPAPPCSACPPRLCRPKLASRWPKRWSVVRSVCQKARACVPALTANPR